MLSKPALRGDDIEIYDAFCLLGASRIWNQVGPQPIPTSEIASYLWSVGETSAEYRKAFIRLIRKMDSAEIAHWQAVLTKNRK